MIDDLLWEYVNCYSIVFNCSVGSSQFSSETIIIFSNDCILPEPSGKSLPHANKSLEYRAMVVRVSSDWLVWSDVRECYLTPPSRIVCGPAMQRAVKCSLVLCSAVQCSAVWYSDKSLTFPASPRRPRPQSEPCYLNCSTQSLPTSFYSSSQF